MDGIRQNKLVTETTILADYFPLWISHCCVDLANLSENTIAGYKQKINNHLVPRLGQIRIGDLTRDDVLKFLSDVKENGRIRGEKPLGITTVRQLYRILSKALTDAVIVFKVIENNPCTGIRISDSTDFEYHWLEEKKEVEFYLKVWSHTGLFLAIYVTLMLGLRRSELLALKWGDINFSTGVMKITRVVITDENNKLIFKNRLKNKSKAKILLVPAPLLQYLKKVRQLGNYMNDDFIILDKNGKNWNPSTFSKKYCEIKKRLPIDQEVRFHDLRHSNASYLYHQGVDIKVISERLGHSDILTTLKYYTHLRLKDQERAVDQLNFNVTEYLQ